MVSDVFYASSEQWKFGVWEVQVRDYVENISLGLPSARLLKQHPLTIVDDELSWTKSHLRPGG